MNDAHRLLRHFLAGLAYRTQKALREAPPGFADFRLSQNVRTPHELIWHMTGVLGYARTSFIGGVWRPEKTSFADEVARFHDVLNGLDHHLERGTPCNITSEQLLQGPFSDAMTHAGQLAMLRRLAGSPVPPENFIFADIRVGNVGSDQSLPVAPDPDWTPDRRQTD